jgi:hypothetical protein
MNPTLLEWLDNNLPPFWAYYHARKCVRGPWAGPVLIAQRSGLTHRTVTRIGAKISWEHVDIGVASAFLVACGFQCLPVIRIKRFRDYMRMCSKATIPFSHLDHRAWKQINKLSRKYLSSRSNNGESKSVLPTKQEWTHLRRVRSGKLGTALRQVERELARKEKKL